MDDTDYHELECALRETEEEIGLSSEFIDVCQYLEKARKVDEITHFHFLGYRGWGVISPT